VLGGSFALCSGVTKFEVRVAAFTSGRFYFGGTAQGGSIGGSVRNFTAGNCLLVSSPPSCGFLSQFDATTMTPLRMWEINPNSYGIVDGIAAAPSARVGILFFRVQDPAVGAGSNFTVGSVSVSCPFTVADKNSL
jgi:hypothetical protein